MNQSINEEEGMKTLNSMIEVIRRSKAIYHPSLFWENLNKLNLEQLQALGYSNFKRSVNQNYFNFLITSPINDQFISVSLKWLKNPKLGVFTSRFEGDKYIECFEHKFKLHKKQSFFYKLFVSMLWEYTRTIDKENLLENLEEPIEGNPLRIFYKGRLISQDLCNSVLEYYSITNYIPHDEKENLTIAELGGAMGGVHSCL